MIEIFTVIEAIKMSFLKLFHSKTIKNENCMIQINSNEKLIIFALLET